MRWLPRESNALECRNRAENVEAMIAMLAANRLQHEKRKHMLLEETARARTIRLQSTAFSAVKLAKYSSPRRRSKRRHNIPPAARVPIINPGTRQKLRRFMKAVEEYGRRRDFLFGGRELKHLETREISAATERVAAEGGLACPRYTKMRRFC